MRQRAKKAPAAAPAAAVQLPPIRELPDVHGRRRIEVDYVRFALALLRVCLEAVTSVLCRSASLSLSLYLHNLIFLSRQGPARIGEGRDLRYVLLLLSVYFSLSLYLF